MTHKPESQVSRLWAIAFELEALVNYLISVTLLGKYLFFHYSVSKSKATRNRAGSYTTNLLSKLDTALNPSGQHHYLELLAEHRGELSVV